LGLIRNENFHSTDELWMKILGKKYSIKDNFKKISFEYHSEVFWEWAPYLVIQHEEQKPLERATINKIDKTLERLNAHCRSLVRLFNASKLTLKHRGRIVKRKSEKDAAGRVAYAKLKAKQKAHKSCAKAFNCNGTELAELRLAEKEYQKYAPCSDCVGGTVPITSLYDRHCPKYAWDGERYTSYSYGGWYCKAGYKRSGNSCVKE
jgi:hypothetical protein